MNSRLPSRAAESPAKEAAKPSEIAGTSVWEYALARSANDGPEQIECGNGSEKGRNEREPENASVAIGEAEAKTSGERSHV
jgi:hypothetical protein